MKIRMYYESKLDKDTIVLDVPDDECAVMVENDYRQRLERARPEERDAVRRRDPQAIIDEEYNKPTYNNYHSETRRHVSLDALDPEGKHISDDSELSDMFNEEDHDRLHRAINYLLPRQRELIRKVFWENMTQASIAQTEGITEQALHERLTLVYERLRRILNSDI